MSGIHASVTGTSLAMPTASGEPHEFRNGVHDHLRHHARTVHLHRLFADSQQHGNLFVELAAGHLFHHLPLAERQRGETFSNQIMQRAFFALGRIEPDRIIDRADETRAVDRFRQKIHGAGLHGIHALLYIPVAGEEDDRARAHRTGQRALQFQPAHSGHAYVENTETRARCNPVHRDLRDSTPRIRTSAPGNPRRPVCAKGRRGLPGCHPR